MRSDSWKLLLVLTNGHRKRGFIGSKDLGVGAKECHRVMCGSIITNYIEICDDMTFIGESSTRLINYSSSLSSRNQHYLSVHRSMLLFQVCHLSVILVFSLIYKDQCKFKRACLAKEL
ncbi:hypothetical protein ALC53_07060 [Atta colombica]|uniref:Uncharacterized protein n=1 Tax=Atta colombica TaxID=520822 RepID=A0A195BED1_9HYME|nr:hypothetical protein ALC53_07060 [Atta colombica]